METLRKTGAFLLAWCCALTLLAAEVIPPAPPRHFNDFANVVPANVEQQLDRALEDLEKSDSTQIVVAVYPKMQSEDDIAAYTHRVAEKWGVGTEKMDNGAALFVFVQDRKMFIQVGYGLEGAIPDITAKDITENRIKPHFARGDFAAGLTAGVQSLIQAARGEYQGTGRTAAGGQGRGNRNPAPFFLIIMFALFAIIGSTRRRRGHVFGRGGRTGWGGPILWTGGGGFGRGGGGFGGGFSGGGGSFGGGGAGSSW